MHVAICDDNGADRKQLERLLKRESDKRASGTGVLYIDSYGNAPALLANPLQYDVFYIDMCHTPGVTVNDIIDGLTSKGVHAPIVLCCSEINYRLQKFPENVIFLDKAIKVADLAESIDHALEIKAKAPVLIELRDEDDTEYVTEDKILYAVAKGYVVAIALKDGRTVNIRSEILNLYSQWAIHQTFMTAGNFIINCRYIDTFTFTGVKMTDGKTFFMLPSAKSIAKMIYETIFSPTKQ